MDLDTARHHIQACLERMRASYLQPVFDEWAILAAKKNGGGVVAYEGPRPDRFKHDLPDDAEMLRAATKGKQLAEGDIEFVLDAAETRYDAFIKTGVTSYLVLNHTKKTMAEIRADGKWLGVQPILFELTEKFRADPLEVE